MTNYNDLLVIVLDYCRFSVYVALTVNLIFVSLVLSGSCTAYLRRTDLFGFAASTTVLFFLLQAVVFWLPYYAAFKSIRSFDWTDCFFECDGECLLML